MNARAPAWMLAAALVAAGCQGRAQEASSRDAAAAPAPVTPSVPVEARPEQSAPADVATPATVEPKAGDVQPAAETAGSDAGEPGDPLWRVKDNKVRCVRAPCPTLDAIPVSSSDATTQVVEVDLSGLGLTPKAQQALLSRVYGEGLRVRGRIEERADKRGRPYKVLKATGPGPQ